MKLYFLGISIITLISAVLLSSCGKDEYEPIQTRSKSCNIEIECISATGGNLLADKSFVDKIHIVGETSHSDVKFNIKNNRLCFMADLPDQNGLKWTNDRREATAMTKMSIKLGKQKASIKCFYKYIANRPPVTVGGRIMLEEVEYKSQIFKRNGNAVTVRIKFDISDNQ